MFCLAQEEDSEAAVPDPNEVSPTLVFSFYGSNSVHLVLETSCDFTADLERGDFICSFTVCFVYARSQQTMFNRNLLKKNQLQRSFLGPYIHIYILGS